MSDGFVAVMVIDLHFPDAASLRRVPLSVSELCELDVFSFPEGRAS